MSAQFKTALIIGAGRGTGRALALQLAKAGTSVTAVARTASDLESLKAEAPTITAHVGDASAGIADDLLKKTQPDLLVIAGGITPTMSSFVDQDWEAFSANWNADTRITYEFLKAAVTLPLKPGGTIVTLSSGAAISGSTLSGGYAGAKKMQHYLTNYTAWESERRGLGLRCYTVYPRQFIAGTHTADVASECYAQSRGVSQATFMAQWDAQLTPEVLAGRILELADRDADNAIGAWGVTGASMEPLS